uniref:Uncharacterized protein n=1 Tax=Anopheles merus TaxID=30066 RepID=A0A182UTR3_ANOME
MQLSSSEPVSMNSMSSSARFRMMPSSVASGAVAASGSTAPLAFGPPSRLAGSRRCFGFWLRRTVAPLPAPSPNSRSTKFSETASSAAQSDSSVSVRLFCVVTSVSSGESESGSWVAATATSGGSISPAIGVCSASVSLSGGLGSARLRWVGFGGTALRCASSTNGRFLSVSSLCSCSESNRKPPVRCETNWYYLLVGVAFRLPRVLRCTLHHRADAVLVHLGLQQLGRYLRVGRQPLHQLQVLRIAYVPAVDDHQAVDLHQLARCVAHLESRHEPLVPPPFAVCSIVLSLLSFRALPDAGSGMAFELVGRSGPIAPAPPPATFEGAMLKSSVVSTSDRSQLGESVVRSMYACFSAPMYFRSGPAIGSWVAPEDATSRWVGDAVVAFPFSGVTMSMISITSTSSSSSPLAGKHSLDLISFSLFSTSVVLIVSTSEERLLAAPAPTLPTTFGCPLPDRLPSYTFSFSVSLADSVGPGATGVTGTGAAGALAFRNGCSVGLTCTAAAGLSSFWHSVMFEWNVLNLESSAEAEPDLRMPSPVVPSPSRYFFFSSRLFLDAMPSSPGRGTASGARFCTSLIVGSTSTSGLNSRWNEGGTRCGCSSSNSESVDISVEFTSELEAPWGKQKKMGTAY